MPKTALEKIYEALEKSGLDDDTINSLLFHYLIEELMNIYLPKEKR